MFVLRTVPKRLDAMLSPREEKGPHALHEGTWRPQETKRAAGLEAFSYETLNSSPLAAISFFGSSSS
jgi:hypothetical protein